MPLETHGRDHPKTLSMALHGVSCSAQTGQELILPRKSPAGTDKVEKVEGPQRHLNPEVLWKFRGHREQSKAWPSRAETGGHPSPSLCC